MIIYEKYFFFYLADYALHQSSQKLLCYLSMCDVNVWLCPCFYEALSALICQSVFLIHLLSDLNCVPYCNFSSIIYRFRWQIHIIN